MDNVDGDGIDYLRHESGFYKIGTHGLVYRWSNFNGEWKHVNMTPEEFNELKEKSENEKAYYS